MLAGFSYENSSCLREVASPLQVSLRYHHKPPVGRHLDRDRQLIPVELLAKQVYHDIWETF